MHQRVHTGEKTDQCAECGKGLVWAHSCRPIRGAILERNPTSVRNVGKASVGPQIFWLIVEYTQERNRTDVMCGKRFRQRSYLQAHLRGFTLRETIYKCEECGKAPSWSFIPPGPSESPQGKNHINVKSGKALQLELQSYNSSASPCWG